MPLSGDAKTKYQRDYMRRKRAGEAAGKAKGKSSGETAALESRVRELGAELARERSRREAAEAELARQRARREAPPLPKTPEEWAAAKERATAERKAKLAAGKAAAAKPAARPMPESEIVARLKTRVRNLQRELTHVREWHKREMARVGKMSRTTFNAVIKCLHPDQRANATETEK